MPKKSRLQSAKDLSPSPHPTDHDLPYHSTGADKAFLTKNDQESASQQAPNVNNIPESLLDEELTRDESQSPPPLPRPSSLLNQLPHGFASGRKSQPLNIRDSLSPSEKVSDQGYTPPSETAWLNEGVYSRSPQAPAIARPSFGQSPPSEPGFSKRNSFTTRTPPISPPQRNARPVSFGAGIPPVPALPQFPPSLYGSPPAPHLPQPHFYAAQDIDLGAQRNARQTSAERFSLVKFTRLPAIHRDIVQGVILGSEQRLEVFAYEGAKLDLVGSINAHSGTVIDACFLTWTSEDDPLQHLRPLIAVTSFGTEQIDEQLLANGQPVPHGGSWLSTTRVEIYSLSTGELVTELLSCPPIQLPPSYPGLPQLKHQPTGSLKLLSSGNFFIISSGASGETFVFGVDAQERVPGFTCITKLWTSIQPQPVRRDSSHQRASDHDFSPSDPRRGRSNDDVPLVAANGRWLAICPAIQPSRQAFGFVLGDNVSVRKNTSFDSSSPPSKPIINCEVDSPDADTLFSKVARGVAQEVVKGARWLGDQGLQAWQSYWKKDSVNVSVNQSQTDQQQYAVSGPYGMFPPTHGDTSPQQSKEPELVSIFDLKLLNVTDTKKMLTAGPMATFQPPRGCSFLSFAPHGLSLITASRKGDFQYVWDLLQIRYLRTTDPSAGSESSKAQPRVRQLARFERLSGTTIVDVAWEAPTAHRFAVLTKNKTIHLFDLPAGALRWPPPRTAKSPRPISAPPDGIQHDVHGPAPAGGFFASAMNLAGQTQPILANLRGRAPSAGSGLAGIGSTGIGIASAAGARGSKTVATGLSKSLGAATETVSRFQQAYESRKHLRNTKDALAGRLMWMNQGEKNGICILEDFEARYLQVRRTRPRDQRQRTESTVFDARKSVVCKLGTSELNSTESEGFWKPNTLSKMTINPVSHPLSFAEIETNAPYQPFHSDRRVTISVYANGNSHENTLLTSSALVRAQPTTRVSKRRSDIWVFGDHIPARTLLLTNSRTSEDKDGDSVIYRETTLSSTVGENELEQIVSTTRRKKQQSKRGTESTVSNQTSNTRAQDEENDQEGFFEDDCDVLDFASNRV